MLVAPTPHLFMGSYSPEECVGGDSRKFAEADTDEVRKKLKKF